MRPINRIVVHCTATRCDVPYTTEMMLRDHKARGFATYGYHYYVRRDGKVLPLRPVAMPGAHARGYNTNSIGVCYEGGLDETGKAADTRTDAQKKSLVALIGMLCAKFQIEHLDGHRDLSPDRNGNGLVEPDEWVKLCPCFDVHTEYASIIKGLNSKQ